MIHPDYIRVYSERRRTYNIDCIIPCEDKEPEYWTRMPENMEYRLGVMRTLRWRKRLKYGFANEWRLQNGAFRKRQDK